MLVMAFGGWSDAAQSASEAADHIVSQYNGKVVASIDPNEYYDFQSSRPMVSLDADGERMVSWPTTEIVLCQLPMREVVVIRGPEPNFRWPSFAAALSALIAVAATVVTFEAIDVAVFVTTLWTPPMSFEIRD